MWPIYHYHHIHAEILWLMYIGIQLAYMHVSTLDFVEADWNEYTVEWALDKYCRLYKVLMTLITYIY